VFKTGAQRIGWDETVFDIGPHRTVGVEKVFDIGPHRVGWDETVFDIGPHRTVGVEDVFNIGANPIINTDPDPTSSPTSSPTTLSPTGSPVAYTYEEIFTEGFDSGMGPYFVDGDDRGSRVRLDTSMVHNGVGQSVRIKDDRDESALYTVDIPASSYSSIMVKFFYQSNKVEEDEGFYFETRIDGDAGGVWERRELFLKGTAWEGNESGWNVGLVEFSVMNAEFFAIKFSGYELGSRDYIFIDDVTVSGK
jgi:hypothetical protein